MRARPHNSFGPAWQTASQLAEMGFCERKVLLKHIYGPRVAPSRAVRQVRGTIEHKQFYMEAREQAPQVVSDLRLSMQKRPASQPGVWQRTLSHFSTLIRLFARWWG